jgi:regulator of replication initiation timing
VAGYVAEEQAESIDVTAPAEIPPAARAQLAAIRDEFVAPLVQQIRELAEENGALKAERDALWSRLEQMEAERDVTVAQNDDPGATELAPPGPNALAAWWDRLMRLFAGG